MALLLLAPYASGAEHQTLALCRYLARRCRVTLLTNNEFAALLRTDPFFRRYAGALSVVSLGRAFPVAAARTVAGALQRAGLYPRLQLALVRSLRRLQPDVVHLVLAPSFAAYAPLFGALPIPVVLTLSGEMRYVRRYYGRAKRAAVQYAVRQADALVACSADELENLRQVSERAARRAVVLDNFTDVERFQPAPAKRPHVVFAARLHPEKGALLYVEAMARVAASGAGRDVQFHLLGKGDLDAQVARRLDELGLDGVVERGFTSDVAPVLAESSIFVSCQEHENLGSSSLLEAMACANAVVATDVGQTWRIVDEAVGARVPRDAGAVAGAVGALLHDQPRAARCGAAARQRVLARYGPERYVDGLMHVYKAALESVARRK